MSTITSDPWTKDKALAREMILGTVNLDEEWLVEVIDGCTDEEKITMRTGAVLAHRSLYYNYDKQTWIN